MSTNNKWRRRITLRCGGANFDAPGTGYSFSAVLAKEQELAKANKPNDRTSALLAMSIADPTGKMSREVFGAGITYYYQSPDATRYTDLRGITPMNVAQRQFIDTHVAIADYLKQRFPGEATAQLTPNWVQYSGHGIKGVLADIIPAALFDPKTILVFPVPGYPVIKSDINRRQAAIIDLVMQPDSTGRWLIAEQLEKIHFDPNAKIVVYVNVPHNPTGTGYRTADWQRLLSWASANDATLAVDEAYIDLCYDEECVSVLTIPGWEKSCIVLQSVSKGWNATGLRFGWMVGHPTIIAALRKVADVKDSGLFGPSIASGLECLAHPELTRETRDKYRRLHQTLSAGLQQAGFAAAMPNAGLCQFTPAPKSANGEEFADAGECAQWLRENLRISVMHYNVDGRPYLRWAVTIKPILECGLPDEAAVIAEAIRRLQEVEFKF
ncbi:MAG: aminotransferase class I/II-fold pyridoxal phosphate-dependent enzyme [Patescibacteria group bacterium]|jgi:LL-diaminopimelate aminotransferase